MVALIALVLTGASVTRAAAPEIVEFPTSCAAGVAADFGRAVALLHSFEYPESEARFRAILERDPDCAMARWGVAMSLWHPLWAPPDGDALAAGEAQLAAIDLSSVLPRERGYIEALSLFYGDSEKTPHATRALWYQARMERVYADNLDDPEAAVFYALALLATADPAEKHYCQQFEAAGLLNWVRASRPNHPGALHYLIHSYDYPGLAHLALAPAMVYAAAAPDSAHAQHMPSHIFTRLGMWDRSIASNHDSTASAAEYTRRAHLPGHYDEGIHSIDYLMYALLQVADDSGAKTLLDDLSRLEPAYPESFKAAYTYAAVPARYVLERRDWRRASELVLLPRDFPWAEFGWAVSINHFARGIGAARSGQVEAAVRELAAIRSIAARLPPDTLTYWREEVLVHAAAVESWIAFSAGDAARGVELANAAADREDAVDKHPVTPGEVLPARELLADMLLQLGEPRRALAQYRTVLVRSPNRTNALLGAARSAAATGNAAAALGYYQAVVGQTKKSSGDRPGVREARAHVRAAGKGVEGAGSRQVDISRRTQSISTEGSNSGLGRSA